ncbi:MAG: phosphopantetheine-binding protein, partial [Acidobacteriota bacterium]|nr:phosphopantetheine-binding protein [Acidobacteriota bacterium]
SRPGALLVLFSSVNSIFGAAGLSAYSAANGFLDLFAQNQLRSGHKRTYCLNWSMWGGAGMSRHTSESDRDNTRALGYRVLGLEEALNSLEIGLRLPPGQLVIGLDAGNPHIRIHLPGESYPLEEPVIKFVASDDDTAAALPGALSVPDKTGRTIGVRLTRVPSLDGSHAAAQPVLTETERQLLHIWRALLDTKDVDPGQSFFLAGGDSLVAMRMLNRIEEVMSVRLTFRLFVDRPTVKGLAAAIDRERRRLRDRPVAGPDLPGDPGALLANLNGLSDDEVERLLNRMTARAGQ